MIKRFRRAGRKWFSAAICGLILILVFPFPATAFSFKKSKQGSAKASFAETADYRILFSFSRRSTQKDPENPKIRWVELSYKYADLEEPPGQRFAGLGGGKIRFLDSEGFVLASDVFSIQDLETGDTYGFLWVEENRARQIVNADAVPLRSDEFPLLKKADKGPAPIAEINEQRAEPLKEEPASPAAALPEEDVVLPSPSPMTSPSPSPAPSASASPDRLERGGVSNEEVKKVLGIQQESTETVIPPSASTLDMPLDEEAQEENKSGVIIKQTFL